MDRPTDQEILAEMERIVDVGGYDIPDEKTGELVGAIVIETVRAMLQSSERDAAINGREFGEVINYSIAAFKKSVPVENIFATNPTDENGYMAAFIVSAIEHYFPNGVPRYILNTEKVK